MEDLKKKSNPVNQSRRQRFDPIPHHLSRGTIIKPSPPRFCFAIVSYSIRVRTSFRFNSFFFFFLFFPRKRRRPPCLHVASVSTELLKVPSRISKKLEEPAKSGGRLQSRRLVKRSCTNPPISPISSNSHSSSLCNLIIKIMLFFSVTKFVLH